MNGIEAVMLGAITTSIGFLFGYLACLHEGKKYGRR